MFQELEKFLAEKGWDEVRIALPVARFSSVTDAVMTDGGAPAQLVQCLLTHEDIESAEFIPAACCINLRFKDRALRGYLEGLTFPLPYFEMPFEATQWEEAILSIRYAHYRAGHLTGQGDVPAADMALARKLAVSAGYCVYRLARSDTEEAYLRALSDFASDYHAWHESLLRARAATVRTANGELMQKEAIQAPLSGALLARSAAAILHDGLQALQL